MIGQQLLHYRVLEKIGEGGMGAVYKALDTHLDRVVAIKVLPPDKVADPVRRQRFIQEAKSASALHHPNIVIVHDIASDRGSQFIVMEYVQGATLDQIVGRKGLKLSEALGYAVQIADGLARAHAAGIVHRDLKPTNIMVTAEGAIKILDFGLAKLTEEVPPAEVEATATLGRMDKPRTEDGFIVGTAAYMSPEQAEGKKVDARSDIFSFGVVLYEVLTGRRAFQRDSRVATLAAILREEPKPAGQISETLPLEVEQLVLRCLRKDPQRRWQNMSDLKVALQDLKEDSESGKLRAARAEAAPRRRNLAWPAAAGILFVGAAAVLAWLIFLKKPPAPPEFEIRRLTFESGATVSSAVSPDGQMFAYASDRAGNGDMDIWVQQVSGEKPLRLTDDPANDWYPSFSPDTSKIVFRSERAGGGIFIADTLGGQARRLTDRGNFPRFSPDGNWISYLDIPASLEQRLNKMFLVPSQGGIPRAFQPEFGLTSLSAGSSPIWSPDGKQVMFYGRRAGDRATMDWWVAPADGGPAVRVNAGRVLGGFGIWTVPYAWAEGYVYFASGTTVEGVNLFRVGIDRKTFQLAGEPQRITSGPGAHWLASVSRDGRIVFSNIVWTANVWVLAADPDRGTVRGAPAPLTQDTMAKSNSSVSRDGSKVAFEAFGGTRVHRDEVRLKDLATGQERTFPSRGVPYIIPWISPDGSTLAYSDNMPDGYHTFILSRDDSAGREVCSGCVIEGIYSDSKDGLVSQGSKELFKLNFATGQKTRILEVASGSVRAPSLSPDDRWLAFVFNRPDGGVIVKVAPLGDQPVSEKDGVSIIEDDRYLGSPQWSPDGRTLYFLSERDGWCCIWGRRLDPITKRPAGDVFPAYHAHQSQFLLNVPPGSGTLGVAKDKMVFYMGMITGNIYMATPKKR
jgi:Tol biopolymer transport system component